MSSSAFDEYCHEKTADKVAGTKIDDESADVVMIEKISLIKSMDHHVTLSKSGKVIIWRSSSSSIPIAVSRFVILKALDAKEEEEEEEEEDIQSREILEGCVISGFDSRYPQAFSIIWTVAIAGRSNSTGIQSRQRYSVWSVTVDLSDPAEKVVATWPGTVLECLARVRLIAVPQTGVWLIASDTVHFYDIKARQVESLSLFIREMQCVDEEVELGLLDISSMQYEKIGPNIILHVIANTMDYYFCYTAVAKKITRITEKVMISLRSSMQMNTASISKALYAFLEADEYLPTHFEVESSACNEISTLEPLSIGLGEQILPNMPIDAFDLMFYLTEPNLVEILLAFPDRHSRGKSAKLVHFTRKIEQIFICDPKCLTAFLVTMEELCCDSAEKRIYDDALNAKRTSLVSGFVDNSLHREEDEQIGEDDNDDTWKSVSSVNDASANNDTIPPLAMLDLTKVDLTIEEAPPRLPRDAKLLLNLARSVLKPYMTNFLQLKSPVMDNISDLHREVLVEIEKL